MKRDVIAFRLPSVRFLTAFPNEESWYYILLEISEERSQILKASSGGSVLDEKT